MLVDYICLQRCLSTVVAVINLCGPVATRLKTRKSTRSPNFEVLPRTSHHRARCGPLYPSSASHCSSLPLCFKTLNTSLSMYSLKNSCNKSFIWAMYVMYDASILRCWQLVMILVKTNHHCLMVGHHRLQQAADE
jgi:hypothetical protein